MKPTIFVEHARDSSSRAGQPILAIVVHATAGTNSLKWLKGNSEGTSIHVLITKTGLIYRMVPDSRAAHHCGYSRWMHNGVIYSRRNQYNVNQVTLGIELENLNNGKDPYPAAQLAACAWQIEQWRSAYGNLVLLHHRDIDTQGKTDPRGITIDDILQHYIPPIQPVTRDSLIVSPPRADVNTCIRAIQRRGTDKTYTDADVKLISLAYFTQCGRIGIDPVVALGHMILETINLRSWWSLRPRRNPASIGVTGASETSKPDGHWSQAPDGRWIEGMSFPTWERHAIPAHLARLVALAVPESQMTANQRDLVASHQRYVSLLPSTSLGRTSTIGDLALVLSPSQTYVTGLIESMQLLMGAP